MGKEDLFMQMEMFMMECGLMIRLTVTEYIAISMELNMKAIGKRINSMARELKRGQMVQNMTVNIFMARNMGTEDLPGQMEALISALLRRTIFKDMVHIIGQMEGSLLEHGLIIRWKEAALFHGLMEENMKEIMWMIRKKDKEYFIGPTVENMKEVGKMESSMEEGFIHLQVVNLSKENGKKEKDFNGLID